MLVRHQLCWSYFWWCWENCVVSLNWVCVVSDTTCK